MSGGATFNKTEKYGLIMNNYIMISCLYGFIIAICLGAGMIGPDIKSGNIYVVLSAINSRKEYFIASICAGCFLYIVVHFLITCNCIIIMLSLSISFFWSDLINVFVGIMLNAFCFLMVTIAFSSVLRGYKSIVIGIFMYVYYYMYTFNAIPFVNGVIQFEVAKYKNILAIAFPAKNIFVNSLTEPNVLDLYCVSPMGMSIYAYQMIYIFIISVIGMTIFDNKNL